MRHNGHSRGRGYDPRLMSSIWCAPQAPSCPTHIYTVLKESRPIKHGGQLHGLMIAIEYSYKLDRKNYFNLWCELGRLLLRQSQMLLTIGIGGAI